MRWSKKTFERAFKEYTSNPSSQCIVYTKDSASTAEESARNLLYLNAMMGRAFVLYLQHMKPDQVVAAGKCTQAQLEDVQQYVYETYDGRVMSTQQISDGICLGVTVYEMPRVLHLPGATVDNVMALAKSEKIKKHVTKMERTNLAFSDWLHCVDNLMDRPLDMIIVSEHSDSEDA